MNRPLQMIAATVAVLTLLTGCIGSSKSSPFEASGRTLQLVAVLPDNYDGDDLKDEIRNTFAGPVGILPQDESAADLMFTTHGGFTQLFRIFRNILYVDIDETKYTKGGLHISRNEFASGQLIITAKAPTLEELKKLIDSQRNILSSLYYQEEIGRVFNTMTHTYSSQMAQMIVDSIGGVTANPPVEIKQIKGSKGFVWGTTLDPTGRTDIVVYDFPYTDPNTFTLDYLIGKRDSVMMQNIHGEYHGSYMTTEKRIAPQLQSFRLNGIYCAEMRGLWQMEGDMMGGPFVMHALVDEANARVVVMECFVFAPGKEKRNLILHGEASLYTLRPAGTELTTDFLKRTN